MTARVILLDPVTSYRLDMFRKLLPEGMEFEGAPDASPETQMDAIRRLFPTQTTIGPVEKIRDLVNSALAGIRTRPLQVAPRQLPYTPNATYFELERNSPFWKELTQSGGMALHVAGDFPQLEMELWAIKG